MILTLTDYSPVSVHLPRTPTPGSDHLMEIKLPIANPRRREEILANSLRRRGIGSSHEPMDLASQRIAHNSHVKTDIPEVRAACTSAHSLTQRTPARTEKSV